MLAIYDGISRVRCGNRRPVTLPEQPERIVRATRISCLQFWKLNGNLGSDEVSTHEIENRMDGRDPGVLFRGAVCES